jgi:predicted nucleotidyltransferase
MQVSNDRWRMCRQSLLASKENVFYGDDMKKKKDPALIRFRQGLDELYGDRLEKAVLFGSRARGDADPDSDYDVAIFLKDMPDRWEEFDRLVPLCIELLDSYEADFTVLPYKKTEYNKKTGLMFAIRNEGVTL